MESNSTHEVPETGEAPELVESESQKRIEGRRMRVVKRVLPEFEPAVAIALVGVALFMLSPAPKATAPLKVSWEPESLYHSLEAEASTTTTVTFMPTQDAENLELLVVAELQPYGDIVYPPGLIPDQPG